MSRRWWTRTVDLAEFIKLEFFDKGQMAVSFDEIVVLWRTQKGVSLATAANHIEQHISAAGDWLRDHGWYLTNVTEYFLSDLSAVIPKTESELRKCIPGLAGPEWPTAGWFADEDEMNELAIMAYFRDLDSGNGKVAKATRMAGDALVVGEADPASIDHRNNQAHLPSTMAQMKRVQKHSQPPPALPAGKKKP